MHNRELYAHIKFKFVSYQGAQTRGNKLKIFQEHVHHDLQRYFSSNRVIQIWNSAPDSVIETNSTNSFKNNLDKIRYNKEAKYNWKANLTSSGSCNLNVVN